MKNNRFRHKIRIKDIAELAGVSEGTVDRVIHNRGEVSAKSLEAVNKALQELNYSPNIFARSLASKKQYRFSCLIPRHEDGDYWKVVEDGFDVAAQEFINYNVVIEKRYFDQFDTVSFVDVADSVLADLPDAVIMAPVFKTETLDFATKLSEKEVPFSFVDSMIEEAGFLTYYGQNSFQSGYIIAKLLLSLIPANSKVLVIRTQRKKGAVSNQTFNRYTGFMQYMEEHQADKTIQLVNLELKDDNEEDNLAMLRDIFAKNPDIKAGVTFNSKVFRLAMHLETLGVKDVRLLGYDLLEKNVHYLKQGVVACLIAQRPDKQSYYSVRDMCRELIFGQEVSKINYVPIDVLMKENIEYYMDFSE
ncbi:LacI family DNA-binding transcriptional regulator [Paludibacter sp. 221]|uniref:LacI family DNA-binding transcriptional regulator n=1 Tax=Paludibacter sp. 221 TaxID=2302939 RepID=UPI0013D02D3E|nr:substrate-binding domain-containing protein [Paludibacter sp. 221]NDV45734.1 LacI family DNA-binding transcriptional regulator [Paludibacter sp. 221]